MQMLFVGDVMLGRLVNDFLKTHPSDYPWGDTLSIFRSADVRVCNLECVISDRGTPWSITPKAFHYRTDAKNVAVLQAGSLDVVSLANNHILDFEASALADCLETLDRGEIKHAGAGNDIVEATRRATLTVQGTTIGFIAFTDNEPDWEATLDRPGVFYVPVEVNNERAKRLFNLVQETKKEVDLLLVSAHWGPNWGYRPQPEHIPFSHALVEAGADVIFGHSCHVFQGVELYRGRPILYSCGDFVDDYAVDEVERNDQSFIFLVTIEGARLTGLELIPTVIRNFQARLAGGREAREMAEKMQALSMDFGAKLKWDVSRGRLVGG